MSDSQEALNVEEEAKTPDEKQAEAQTGKEVYFDVIICDNTPDRANDVFSLKALNDIVDIINKLGGVPYIKNHDMSDVENIIANIKSAELVQDNTKKTVIGEPYTYVLGKACAKEGSNEYLDKILSGLWRNSSIRSENVYEVKDGYNVITDVADVIEVSSVCVGCQPKARVCLKSIPIEGNKYKAIMDIAVEESKEHIGGNHMKVKSMLFKRICTAKGLPEDIKEDIAKAIDTPEDAEVSESDVNALIEENAKLKEQIAELLAELDALKGCMKETKVDSAVEAAIDGLEPINDRVKEDMIDKVDKSKIEIDEDGTVKGLDEQITTIAKMYDGLCGKAKVTSEASEAEKTGAVDKKTVAKSIGPTFTIGKKASTETAGGKVSSMFGL